MGRNIKKRRKEKSVSYFDYNLLFVTIFLLCFGLVIIYSASAHEGAIEYGNPTHFVEGQLKAILFGLIPSIIVIFFLDYHAYKVPWFAFLIYVAGFFFTVLVATSLGIDANGAKRWIRLPGFTVQVCEIVKISVIIFMAFLLDRVGRKIKNRWVFWICFAFAMLPVGVVLKLTKDLSSSIVIAAIGCVMLFVTCHKWTYFIWVGILGVLAFIAAIIDEPFRLERFRIWLNPEQYPDKGGYQIIQSLYSLGSGGIFGKGLGNGVQKLGYVPEAQNDMVFTVVCEELGIVGAICVLLVFVFMIWRFMIIANNAPDLFGSLIVIGVMTHISVQTIINIAVVTNSMPNTGLTLPFLSCGGSSVLCLMVEISLVLAVSRRIKTE